MKFINKINGYIFHYRKFGKSGVALYSNIQKNNDDVFSVSISGVKHPFYLRGKTSDIPTFYQIFSYKEYKIGFDFKPKYILDLGANIGLASIYFKNLYPEAKIIAVEPDKSNFELLVRNTKPYKDIICVQAGIWGQNSRLEILDIGKGNWAFMTEEVKSENINGIDAVTIDSLLNRFGFQQIDILKMDIEGAEKEVFEGNYNEWIPKTKALIVELHDRYKKGCSEVFFKAMINYKFSTRLRGESIICDFHH